MALAEHRAFTFGRFVFKHHTNLSSKWLFWHTRAYLLIGNAGMLSNILDPLQQLQSFDQTAC